MTRFKHIALITALLVALPLLAWAKPDIVITIKAEKEVVVTENGKQVKKIVEAKDITPGEIITYTLAYANRGTEAATNVVLSDPIPAGTTFINGSESQFGDVTFSIDGGKTYKKPTLLFYEVKLPSGKIEKQTASAEQYTDIRWTIPKIDKAQEGKVTFKVRVK